MKNFWNRKAIVLKNYGTLEYGDNTHFVYYGMRNYETVFCPLANLVVTSFWSKGAKVLLVVIKLKLDWISANIWQIVLHQVELMPIDRVYSSQWCALRK